MDIRDLLKAISRVSNHPIVRTMFSHVNTIMSSIENGSRYGVRLLFKLSLWTGVSVLAAGTTLWLSFRLFKRLANLSNGAPGPMLPKLIEYWKQLQLYRGTYQTKLVELHRTYGLIVQIGPSEFSVSDISALPYWWRLEKVRLTHFSHLFNMSCVLMSICGQSQTCQIPLSFDHFIIMLLHRSTEP